jgi:5-methylcytosine-specific restriction endonuclease McrA
MPATTADHVVSVYDADAVVGAGIMTPDEARATVNATENMLGACTSCNPSKGAQLPGNVPGTWQPPDPTLRAIEKMKELGTWKEDK